jgi:AAA domain
MADPRLMDYADRLEAEAPTWRTLAEIDDAPPVPLLLGMLEPDGPTLAYGAPGVGKGTSASWMTRELQQLGMRVGIYDAERRPREWARRIGGLGGDRSQVVYVDPTDLGRAYVGRPIWDAEPALRAIVRGAGVDLLIVDSILPTVGVGEERLRGDAQAPYLYVGALDALGIPSLSLGHPPKGQPEGEPYGSMAWVGAMRLTWLGTNGEREGHQVRWRPRKRNERGHIPGVLLTFSYGLDGRLSGADREDDEESTREAILAALVAGPRTIAELTEEMLDHADEAPTADTVRRTEERLGRTMRRLAHDGLTAKAGKDGRAVRWALPLS